MCVCVWGRGGGGASTPVVPPSLGAFQDPCLGKLIPMIIFSKLNREKTLIRHVALVAKFLDDDKVENVTSNCFKLHRSYSVSFNLSNVGEIFCDRIRKDHI